MLRKLKILLAREVSKFFLKTRKLDNCVPILCYHRVLPEFVEDVNNPIYTLLPERFESQMEFLAAEGYNSLSLHEFAEMAQGLRPLKKPSVLITFDDGYADNYHVAWPIAKKHHIKLNLFICTGYIGSTDPILFSDDGYTSFKLSAHTGAGVSEVRAHLRHFPHLWRPLNWPEIQEMAAAGVQIGFHSHRHRRLSLLTPEELVADTAAGIETFARNLGYPPQFFALPYGWYGAYTSEVIHLLNSLGLQVIFTTHIRRARLPSSQLIFPRITILQQDNQQTFQQKLLGGYDWLETLGRIGYQISHFLKRRPG